MVSQTIRVMDMTCDHCAQTIKKAVVETAGVKQIDVNLQKKLVCVEFDENQTDSKTIIAAIVDAGYEVEGQSEK